MFSVLQPNTWNYSEDDLCGCLYNGVKLIFYFSPRQWAPSHSKNAPVYQSAAEHWTQCVPAMRLGRGNVSEL